LLFKTQSGIEASKAMSADENKQAAADDTPGAKTPTGAEARPDEKTSIDEAPVSADDMEGHEGPPPLGSAPLAYENPTFLNGPDGRLMRIVAEYMEPLARFRH
jgi:hypothetical protein